MYNLIAYRRTTYLKTAEAVTQGRLKEIKVNIQTWTFPSDQKIFSPGEHLFNV